MASIRRALLASLLSVACAAVGAQSATFDVASIKPNNSASGASSIGFEQGGRFRAINEPIVRLIQEAYATAATLRPQVVGAPGWVDSDRFDVEAVATGAASPEQRQLMLRAMLVERLRLAAHTEARDRPVYYLVRPSPAATLGNTLHVSDGSCDALRAPGAPTPTLEQIRPCMLAFGTGSLRVNGMTAAQFATAGLTRVVDRPVIDRTELGTTVYDWAIEWMPEPASATTNLPGSVFSAVQEQLGLRLEPATGKVDVVVVERVEKPTAD